MRYDAALRELTGSTSPALIKLLTGVALAEPLPTEFPEVKNRRVDALARLSDDSLLHIEWQTGPDAAMPLRMLGYWLNIAEAYPGDRIRQMVIQTRGGPPIADHLDAGDWIFRYRVIDCRDLDPTPLLDSPALSDNLLSLLFGDATGLRDRVRVILSRLTPLEQRRRQDALSQMLILGVLRDAAEMIFQEAQTMPLALEPITDPFIINLIHLGEAKAEARGVAQGVAQGEARALVRLIERQFGPVSADLRARIFAADSAQLSVWFDRALDAPTLQLDLEAVLAEPPSPH